LIVELDGYAFHSSRPAFVRDRIRDAELHAAGHRVLHLAYAQVADEPHALTAQLAVTLAAAA
jgi:very-short-patch-repair endonuclease